MMNCQNRYSAPEYNTFSAAASVAPIVLWSGHSTGAGNVYAAAKNTFLEFYTDEKKAIKRSAAARSASCDSTITADRSSGKSTAEPTTRSPSLSNRSVASSGGNSPDATPRNANNYRYHHANYYDNAAGATTHYQHHNAQYYDDASYNINYDGCHEYYDNASYMNYDGGHDNYEGGFRMMMVPMMMPSGMMSSVDEQEQEMVQGRPGYQPQVVKPPAKSGTKSERFTAKKQDLRELNTEPVEEITTLMFRGIPCSFSQDTLMKTIDHAGLKGKYDFFYLPRVGNHGSNLGYAFINFSDQAGAEQCMATFNGVPLDPARSTKTCTISHADIQGLANLRKHFRRTAVSRGARGPVFLKVFSGEEDDNVNNAGDDDEN
jgi:hypothetical protein